MAGRKKVKKREFAVHLDPELHRKLKLRANLDGLTISGAVAKLVEKYVKDLSEILGKLSEEFKPGK